MTQYRLKLVAHLLIKKGENSWLLTEFLCKILIAYANGNAKRQNSNVKFHENPSIGTRIFPR
jgi:hypothetical protein